MPRLHRKPSLNYSIYDDADVPEEPDGTPTSPQPMDVDQLDRFLDTSDPFPTLTKRVLKPEAVERLLEVLDNPGSRLKLEGCVLEGAQRLRDELIARPEELGPTLVGDLVLYGAELCDGRLVLEADCRIPAPLIRDEEITRTLEEASTSVIFSDQAFDQTTIVALEAAVGAAAQRSLTKVTFTRCTFGSLVQERRSHDREAPIVVGTTLIFDSCLIEGSAWLMCETVAGSQPEAECSVTFDHCAFVANSIEAPGTLALSGCWTDIEVSGLACSELFVQNMPSARNISVAVDKCKVIAIDGVSLSGTLSLSSLSGTLSLSSTVRPTLTLADVEVQTLKLEGYFNKVTSNRLDVRGRLTLQTIKACSIDLARAHCGNLVQTGSAVVRDRIDLSQMSIEGEALIGPLEETAGSLSMAQARVGSLKLVMPLNVKGELDFSQVHAQASEVRLFDVQAGSIRFDGAWMGGLHLGLHRESMVQSDSTPEEAARRKSRLAFQLRPQNGKRELRRFVHPVKCTGTLSLSGVHAGTMVIGPSSTEETLAEGWAIHAVQVGGDLEMCGVAIGGIGSASNYLIVRSTKVGGVIRMQNAECAGLEIRGDGCSGTGTDYVEARRLEMDGSRVARDVMIAGLRATSLSMRDTRIESGCLRFFNGIKAAKLSGLADLVGLRAERVAVNRNCLAFDVKLALDLVGAKVGWLQYEGRESLPRPIRLRGAEVGLLDASAEDKCDLALETHTPHLDGALLSRLARELEEEGRTDLSDQVLRTLRVRQLANSRDENRKAGRHGRALWLSLVGLVWHALLDYGAKPLRPLAISTVLSALLLIIFLDPRNIVASTAALTVQPGAYTASQAMPRKDEHPAEWSVWNAVWFAGARALPAVEMHVEEDWQASSTSGVLVLDRRLPGSAEHWAAGIGLLNLLLVPIALLAIGRRALIRFKD